MNRREIMMYNSKVGTLRSTESVEQLTQSDIKYQIGLYFKRDKIAGAKN